MRYRTRLGYSSTNMAQLEWYELLKPCQCCRLQLPFDTNVTQHYNQLWAHGIVMSLGVEWRRREKILPRNTSWQSSCMVAEWISGASRVLSWWVFWVVYRLHGRSEWVVCRDKEVMRRSYIHQDWISNSLRGRKQCGGGKQKHYLQHECQNTTWNVITAHTYS